MHTDFSCCFNFNFKRSQINDFFLCVLAIKLQFLTLVSLILTVEHETHSLDLIVGIENLGEIASYP